MELKIYKKSQATYTRLGTAITVLTMVGFGCWRLYEMLRTVGIVDATIKIWVQSLVPIVVFGLFVGLTYWLLNIHSIADFMINAESEIKKVNWSSRKEIVVSTIVVIVVVVLLSAFLGATDIVFQFLFRGIGLLPS